MTLSVRIEGVKAIEDALSELDTPAAMKKTLTKASAAAAKIMRASLKSSLSGHGTGAEAKSVRYKVMRRSTTKLVGHVVAPMGRYASARALVEYGHGGPHPAPAYPRIQAAFSSAEEEAQAAAQAILFAALKEF